MITIGGIERDVSGFRPSPRRLCGVKPAVELATLPLEIPPVVSARGAAFPRDFDQGRLSACGPNSIAELYQFFLAKGPWSRLFLYFWTRAVEKDIADDAGVTIVDLLDVAHTMGMPPEDEWPYDPARLTDTPPVPLLARAFAHRVASNDVVVDVDHLLFELANGQPVTFGMQLPTAISAVGSDGIVPMPASADDCEGWHCVNAMSASRSRELVQITHHWGRDVGDVGTFWIPFGYFTQGFARDMRAVRGVT